MGVYEINESMLHGHEWVV